MALFGEDQSLEDILGQQSDSARMDITNQFAKKRRQSVAQQAHGGRLTSGVSNYQAGDLAGEELGALGGVESDLAAALGQIPADDYVGMRQNDRDRQLAELIGRLSKPSALEQTFGLMQGGTRIFGGGSSIYQGVKGA